MKTIHVAASRSYDILIERGILTRAGEEIKKVCGAGEALIVSEDTVWPLYGETVLSSMKNAGFDVTSFTFPHGEQSKNLSVYAEILNALAARHISRKGLIVALGGGVFSSRSFNKSIKQEYLFFAARLYSSSARPALIYLIDVRPLAMIFRSLSKKYSPLDNPHLGNVTRIPTLWA